jgi:5'-deoxynucleotidase YfbR-like HD superfamily hydrolase
MFILAITVLVSNCTCTKIILRSPVLDVIDGIKFCIDENAMENMINTRRWIKELQYGKIDEKTKTVKKRYVFKGQRYTLTELVQIEAECEKKYGQFKRSPDSNARHSYEATISALKAPLEAAKSDISKLIKEALQSVTNQRMKDFIVVLIEQFLEQYENKNSYLRDWGKCPFGQEQASFNTHVTSLQFLNTFCVDLRAFLKAMRNSCPKAYKKYLETHPNHGRT